MNLSSAAPIKLVAVITPATLMSFSTRTWPVRVEIPETSRVVTEAMPPMTLVATPEIVAKSDSSAAETLLISISTIVESEGSAEAATLSPTPIKLIVVNDAPTKVPAD